MDCTLNEFDATKSVFIIDNIIYNPKKIKVPILQNFCNKHDIWHSELPYKSLRKDQREDIVQEIIYKKIHFDSGNMDP